MIANPDILAQQSRSEDAMQHQPNADNKMQLVMTDERFKRGALELGTAMAFEGDSVQRAADEIEFALRKDDDNIQYAWQ